ncbi:MAG TPA: deoxyribonuclease IV [bacterium]|nr:deoxyribonuclease IV [bacterium]HPN29375.1 deoxyribonuclease IV [bacterium]
MKIGAHFSISGGISNSINLAEKAGAEYVQIFISNPRAWADAKISEEEAELFIEKKKTSAICGVAVHMPYLPNTASPEKIVYRKSIAHLKKNIDAAESIGADFYIIHPGKSMGSDTDKAIKRVADAVNILISNTKRIPVLIENTAGQGSELGFTFFQLGAMLDRIKNKKRCGICLDTAHLFGAGYDFSNKTNLDKMLKELKSNFDISFVKAFHLNDTTVNLGSNVDRHFYIDRGKIGIKGLTNIIKCKYFSGLPGIVETPEEEDPNHLNAIALLKKINDE